MPVVLILQREKNQQEFVWPAVMNVMEAINYLSCIQKEIFIVIVEIASLKIQNANLFPDKTKVNSGNKYNDNFFGFYCFCKRPYPDPEDEVPGEMIQCIVCEDWFHGRHLGAVPLRVGTSKKWCARLL